MAQMNEDSYESREEREAAEKEKRKKDLARFGAGILAAVKLVNDRSPENMRSTIRKEWNQEVTKRVIEDIKNDQHFKDAFAPWDRHNETREQFNERRILQAQLRKKITEDVPAMVAELSALHGDQIYEKGTGTTVSTRQTTQELVEENHPTIIVSSDEAEINKERATLLSSISKAQNELSEEFRAKNDANNAKLVKKYSAEELAAVQAREMQEAQAGVLADREFQKENQELNAQTEAILKSDLSEKEKQNKLKEIGKAREQAVLEAQINQEVLVKVLTNPESANLTSENFAKLYQKELDQAISTSKGWGKYNYRHVDREKLQSRSPNLYLKLNNAAAFQIKPLKKEYPPPQTNDQRQWSFSWPRFNVSSWKVDFPGFQSLFRSASSGIFDSIGSGVSNITNFASKLSNLGSTAKNAANLAKLGSMVAGGGGAAVGGATIALVGLIIFLVVAFLLIVVFNNPVAQPQAIADLSPSPNQSVISPAPEPSTSVTPKPPFKMAGMSLEEVMKKASTATCTPLAMIKAISRREASTTWNYSETQFGFYNSYPWWNNAELTELNTICSGFGYNTCTNQIPTDSKFGSEYCKGGPVTGLCRANVEVMGPMQFEKGTWTGYVDDVEKALKAEGQTRQADRRVIFDAFIAAGTKLHNDSKAQSCTNWTPTEIAAAAGAYYGKCEYTIGNGGNYCREVCDYYNEYSNQTVDCSQI